MAKYKEFQLYFAWNVLQSDTCLLKTSETSGRIPDWCTAANRITPLARWLHMHYTTVTCVVVAPGWMHCLSMPSECGEAGHHITIVVSRSSLLPNTSIHESCGPRVHPPPSAERCKRGVTLLHCCQVKYHYSQWLRSLGLYWLMAWSAVSHVSNCCFEFI